MSLSAMLSDRASHGRPVRVGLIGCGKFGTMFLAQARSTLGLHVAAVADCDPGRAHTALADAQWPPAKAVARSLAEAMDSGGTMVASDAMAMLGEEGLDVVIEATGDARAGVAHAMAAIEAGVHVVMATVSADVLAGPVLAMRAADKDVIYSLAYGDQPALLCQLVDWARCAGFEVAGAGKGTRWRPVYRAVTPDTVWACHGISPERARVASLNPRMFTSLLDGTKSAMEMAAVCNATGLEAPVDGLTFPPCGSHDLVTLMKPRGDGGILPAMGRVEVISSEERDGRHVVGDLASGVWVTVRASSPYSAACFEEYGLAAAGPYAALWRPCHLIGMELGLSVASVALRREATGCPRAFAADVVAMAKRDLAAGEVLDGEGGHTVWGRLTTAQASANSRALPIGLAGGLRLRQGVAAGAMLTLDDVDIAPDDGVLRLRREASPFT